MASPSGTPTAAPVPSQQSSPPPPFDHSVLLRHVNPSSNPNANPNPTAPLPTSIPFYGGGTAVPSGPYSYPPATPPFNIRPFMPPHAGPDSSSVPRPIISYPLPSPNTSPSNPNPNPGPNPGIRLMQLLGNNSPSHIESAASMPPTQNPSPIPSPTSSVPILSQLLPAMPSSVPPTGPARMSSTKMPRGRHLGGGEVTVHDVDSRLPGEVQAPQLEVTPITKYTSDPGLVLGRQIAVNRSYIVYGLKMGSIRILNIHTALRSLLRGHTQRVTDMAFFAEDVHYLASASVDGRIYVWKIDEGPDAKETPQIAGKIITALQIVGETRSYHPRICWHSHKQEILYVGIANRVLKIDTTKVGRGKDFNAEEPLICPLDKLIDGVYLVGKHDDDVTDLSISQWMMTRLASASKDGTVKIWDDKNKSPITWINAHDGQPVNSVAFLASPETPSHVNLVTSGPLNREIKIWSTVSEEGWLLPSESEKWQCTQTLDLKSSSEPNHEEAFFNQVAVLPQASLIILANAKKNAIYAIHVDYNSCPISTRMDYVADFTVTMPILSLTGSCESLPNGEQVVQVYCVQTMAIQQYALELSLCMPPPVHDGTLIRESSVPVLETMNSKSDTNNTGRELNSEAANETKPSVPPPLVYTESNVSAQSFDGMKSPQNNIERGQSSSERDIEQAKDELPLVENTRLAFSPTHLITPNMISGSSPVDPNHTEEVKVNQVAESETAKEPQVVLHETKEQPNIETVNETKVESQTLDEGRVAESSSRDEALKGASELVEENKEREKAKAEESSFRVFNSTGSNAANNSTDAEQNFAIYDMLQQIMNAQKEIPKQVNMLLAKEGKRIETSLGRNMEKSIKANAEALWARHLEDNAKREKTEKERIIQPLSNSIMSSLMKELPALHERALRKELTNLGPVLARAVTPAIEKHISSVIPEAIQKAVSEKVVNQLEKSVSSKLDGTIARQIQAQFQTSGRQALQETLRSCVESSMVPAFERSCKAMFDQVDASFHKGMAEHTSAVQQQYDASQTPLALTLRDTINSASSMTQAFTSELLDVPRKVLAIVAQGNTKSPSTVATQSVNGLVPGLPEIVEAPVDPTKELTRLITDRKYEEAFTMALQRSDVSIVSWLCTQVDLRAMCSMAPLPLNQGVLLALLQQLACDIVNDTSRKVVWMTDVAVAINPTDPMIAMHVRPICEQVYNILVHHRSLPTTSSSDGASIKLVIHVINSVLMSCK